MSNTAGIIQPIMSKNFAVFIGDTGTELTQQVIDFTFTCTKDDDANEHIFMEIIFRDV